MNNFEAYVAQRLNPRLVSFSGSATDYAARDTIRNILQKSPIACSTATYGEDLAIDTELGDVQVIFGEGSPGFTPEEDCIQAREGDFRLTGQYANSPWCVQKLVEVVDEAFKRTTADVDEAVRKKPELASEPRVVQWRRDYDNWKSRRSVMNAQIQTAKDNSETWEGEPDDEDESAKNIRLDVEQIIDRTASLRSELKNVGVELRTAVETEKEKTARAGEKEKSDKAFAADISRNVAIGAVALAAVVGIGQILPLLKSARAVKG